MIGAATARRRASRAASGASARSEPSRCSVTMRGTATAMLRKAPFCAPTARMADRAAARMTTADAGVLRCPGGPDRLLDAGETPAVERMGHGPHLGGAGIDTDHIAGRGPEPIDLGGAAERALLRPERHDEAQRVEFGDRRRHGGLGQVQHQAELGAGYRPFVGEGHAAPRGNCP